MTSDSQLSYLDRVVMEIVETERTYVRDLRMIVEDYLSHIIEQSPVSLSPDQVVRLFGNIEDIYEFNSELLQCLDLCDKDPVAVARCFVTKREDFTIYTQFCNNYPNSVAALTDCMRNKAVAKFFRDRQATLQKPLPLGSYLLKPVQRILKYHLLLQEIAKNFKQDDEGFEVIEEAICTMTAVACYINDMKRKHEHAVRLQVAAALAAKPVAADAHRRLGSVQEVQSLLVNWKGPDLTTYGELVLEGSFKLHGAKHQRTLFLFQRLLLITRRRVEHFIYKTHISCSTLMLIDTKDPRSFSVTHYKRPKKPHTVQARSVEERELWAHHIKRIILENHQAIIPQKDKDAAVDLCPRHHPRHHFSPERVRTMAPAEGSLEPQSVLQQVGLTAFWPMMSDHTNILSVLDTKQEAALPRPLPEGAEPAPPQRRSVPRLECTEGVEPARRSDLPGSSVPEDPETEVEEPALAAGDSRALSSGESSDEEEDEEDERQKGPARILPPSVLNKAGDIASHLSSIRRPSWSIQAPEPAAGPGCGRRSDPDGLAGSPERRRCSDSGGWRRRDSFLTHHERLLIGKIKSYYESAASQDGGLGLQRRESLSHIPTGLVRTSVTRFNRVPGASAGSSASASGAALLGPIESSQSLSPASQSLDSPASGPTVSVEEALRPSSEVTRIWQTMASPAPVLASEPSASSLTHQDQNQSLDNTADEVKATLLIRRPDLLTGGSCPQDRQAPWVKSDPERSEAAEDRAESKVLHLARCYSQRLRESKPAVPVRSPEIQMDPSTPAGQSAESPADELVQRGSLHAAAALTRAHQSAAFHWPDVRELRSKYSTLGPRRPSRSSGSFTPERGPQVEPSIHGGASSAPHLSTAPSSEFDLPCGRPHVAAQAVKGPECETASENSDVEEQTYVQIRSPTSREKISILAVVDRCRAYQDSKEYRQREALGASGVQDQHHIRPKAAAEHNLVKNLRDKFQKFP
ncbi:pleckstrin homology domain-containing family G member 3-like isoform X3 [Synchiropus splendidus]|uniref:pleckstrin homology domain-containing family G member 3-like isoform X3 n=1 Tax=Synchiropus splendidus TaxID=270530 RepID=UPI00237EA960|nr:pleckstrin homology domain-containing family G member 3-like isoform X3 [Synchiropus splendidus]